MTKAIIHITENGSRICPSFYLDLNGYIQTSKPKAATCPECLFLWENNLRSKLRSPDHVDYNMSEEFMRKNSK